MSVTKAGLIGAVIQKGRIVDVDMASYTLTVATEFLQNPLPNVSFATPYQHYANGEGIYFMPEVGGAVWICYPSDHSKPFVLAWAADQSQGNFRASKKELNPGDIYMGTRDENFIILRRGGIVQIGGGPLSQRMYIPVQNFIKDFCENYALRTLGGDLEWLVRRPETSTSGKNPASLKISAREFTDDPKPIAELEIGSHDGDDNTILSLNVSDTGSTGNQVKVSLTLGKDGSVNWECESAITISGGGTQVVVDSSGVKVAGGKFPVVLHSTDLEAWITAVTGALLGSGPAARVPTLAAPSFHVSTKLSSD